MSKALEHANIAQLACDDCKGFEACKEYVAEGAPFYCQAATFADLKTVEDYAEWCVGLAKACPGYSFDVHNKVWDETTRTAIFFCTYHATHTSPEGHGPDEPTGKTTNSDYVYFFKVDDNDKITSMHKVWNDGYCLSQLGWA